MARSIRIEFAGAFYHVMARGNHKEAIYQDDDDRRFFMKCVAEACEKTGWVVHAWVLMNNHYHLFLETPEPNLVEGMKWLQNTYTRRFNVRHKEWGRLFGDRYKAILVQGDESGYYEKLWNYIHLNPFRAAQIKAKSGGSILDYPWSSIAGGYALPPGQRPKWLAGERSLRILGYNDTPSGRGKMIRALDNRAAGEGRESGSPEIDPEADARRSNLRRGWYFGSRQFADQVLKKAEAAFKKTRKSRAYGGSRERAAHGEVEARRILKECLKAAALHTGDLSSLRSNDPRKVLIATLLWNKTTVGQRWIADELAMRSAANVSLSIHRSDWKKIKKLVPAALVSLSESMQ